MTHRMRRTPWAVAALAGALLCACQSTQHAHDDGDHAHAEEEADHGHAHGSAESWAVTSWGEHFEIFAEADPLIAGVAVNSHTHVTVLEDFSPLRTGVVSVVLRSASGNDEVFTQNRALRDGIFDIAIAPRAMGEYTLLFRVEGAGRTEEIASGRVVVGDADHPGGLVTADALGSAEEEVSFLKEQQWKTRFATAWVREGRIRESVRGTGVVRPARGGELHLAAPIDGIVASEPWPHPGLAREAGEVVVSLSSRVSQGRTLAELQAIETEKKAELGLARERLKRLESLLEVGAVSHGEVDAARARAQTLAAQSASALNQMAAVRGAGSGRQSALLEVTAPFAGEVAEVLVTPGQAVSAGDPLARLVRVEPVWVEVYLSPGDATRLEAGVSGLWVRSAGQRARTLFEGEQVDLVSIAPEVRTRTGRVTCLLQVGRGPGRLRLGTAVEADVLLEQSASGLVVATSAVVDDAGVPTVFVQRDGETFERREVRILGREGDNVMVTGVAAGDRIVTAGGSAIRRASMVSSGGAGHGHVH